MGSSSSPRVLFAALILAGAMGFAQLPSVTLTEPATPLLPQQFSGWTMDGVAKTGGNAAEIDAARAPVLKEDGLSRFSMARYTHGGSALEIEAMQFVDATGASAAVSLYRGGDTNLRPFAAGQRLGAEAVQSADEVVFRSGNTVAIAHGARVATSDLLLLAGMLPKIGGPKGVAPLLPTLLPAKGLDGASLRYSVGQAGYAATGGFLPGDILGFEKAAEAVTGVYNLHGGKDTVTLLLYPTPEIAGERGRAVEGWLNAHKSGLGAGLGTAKLRREGPLLLLATGTMVADDAQRMIENIHLRSEVTWEKPMPPEFHAEVRKTASLLSSIMILAGVLMLAAVLLGLFLGVGRATMRVWLGKSAASEPEFLNLGLPRGPSKPIS